MGFLFFLLFQTTVRVCSAELGCSFLPRSCTEQVCSCSCSCSGSGEVFKVLLGAGEGVGTWLLHHPFQSSVLTVQHCPLSCPPHTVASAFLTSLLGGFVGTAPLAPNGPLHPPAVPAEPGQCHPSSQGLAMSPPAPSSAQRAQQNPTFSSSQGACPARINHYTQ